MKKKTSQVRKPKTMPAKPDGTIGEADLNKVAGSGGAAGGVADRSKPPIQPSSR
jgi:hypothetical protein